MFKKNLREFKNSNLGSHPEWSEGSLVDARLSWHKARDSSAEASE